ncbi:MAG TPA: DUF4442 domain-containing protein [Thermoanaerobaculia bacterium]
MKVDAMWRILPVRWRPLAFNLFPAFRGTGARVRSVSADFREITVELPLNWRTRNYVGTTFGGSLYAAVDPFYMIMLIRNLGPGYVVWDKSASIRFRKPGRSALFARFLLPESETDEIRRLLEIETSIDRPFRIELKDAQGIVHAEVEKTIYIRRQTPRHDDS